MSIEERFVKRMINARRKGGVSQNALARLLSDQGFPFHQPTVARIEAGERGVSLNEAAAIAEVLELSLQEMCRGEDEVPDKASLYGLLDELDYGNLPGSKVRWQGHEIWLHTTPQVEGWIRTFIEKGADPS